MCLAGTSGPTRLRRRAVTIKTALLALVAAAAIIGAAIIGVPSTAHKIERAGADRRARRLAPAAHAISA